MVGEVQERNCPGLTPITLTRLPLILIAPPLTLSTARTPPSFLIFGRSAAGIPVWMTASTSGATSWRGSEVAAVVRVTGPVTVAWEWDGWPTGPDGTTMTEGPTTPA